MIKGISLGDRIKIAMLDLQTSIEFSKPVRAITRPFDDYTPPAPARIAQNREAGTTVNKSSSLNTAHSNRVYGMGNTGLDSAKRYGVNTHHTENNVAASSTTITKVDTEKKKEEQKETKEKSFVIEKETDETKIPLINGDNCQYVSQDEYASIMKNLLSSKDINPEIIIDGINATIVKMFKDVLEEQLKNKTKICSVDQIREFMDYISDLLSEVSEKSKKKNNKQNTKKPELIDTKAVDVAPPEEITVIEDNNSAASNSSFGVKEVNPLDEFFGKQYVEEMIKANCSEQEKVASEGFTDEEYQRILHDPNNPFLAFKEALQNIQNASQQVVQNPGNYEYVQTRHPGAPIPKERPIVPRKGQFAVDAPTKIYPPTAEADKIQADVQVNNLVTPPDPIDQEAAKVIPPEPLPPAPEIEPEKPIFDNKAIIEKYPYMGKIEEIALKNGIQLQMQFSKGDVKNNNGIIIVFAYYNGKVEYEKSFSIDTGVMIDRRTKFYPGPYEYGFENINPYYMTDKPSKDQKTGKHSNEPILKEKMFDDWFKGGENNIDVGHMYNSDDFELNKRIAMITLPKKDIGNNKDVEKAIRNRLIAAMKAGILDRALQNIPNGRFKFKADSVFGTVDKNTNKPITNFIITTEDVPIHYACPEGITSKFECMRLFGVNRLVEMIFNKNGTATFGIIDKK